MVKSYPKVGHSENLFFPFSSTPGVLVPVLLAQQHADRLERPLRSPSVHPTRKPKKDERSFPDLKESSFFKTGKLE